RNSRVSSARQKARSGSTSSRREYWKERMREREMRSRLVGIAARPYRPMLRVTGVTGVACGKAQESAANPPVTPVTHVTPSQPLECGEVGLPSCGGRPAAQSEDSAPGLPDAEIERAAIMEFDGDLPREIAEGLARLDSMKPPIGFTDERWAA